MMKYKYILFDADDTLLDFSADERNAFFSSSRELDIIPTDEMYDRYSEINLNLWKRYEKGEINQNDIGHMRYSLLIKEYGLFLDPSVFDTVFRKHLSNGGIKVKNAESVCSRLFEKGYSLYIVSNGDEKIQTSRFNNSGLGKYIKKCYFSGKIGYQKPDKAFFDIVFSDIGSFDKEKYLIVGDSLTSDISGGKNAGIQTCHFNRFSENHKENLIPDYEIKELTDLLLIL